MKTLILPFLLLVTFATFAQKPIKITTEIDDFTGDTTIKTSFIKFQEPLGGGTGLMFTLIYQEDRYYIASIMAMKELCTMDAQDEMILKLAYDTTVTLYASSHSIADYNGNGSYTLTTVYPISQDQLVLMIVTPIEKVRIKTSAGNQDRSPSPKKASEACMDAFGQFIAAVTKERMH